MRKLTGSEKCDDPDFPGLEPDEMLSTPVNGSEEIVEDRYLLINCIQRNWGYIGCYVEKFYATLTYFYPYFNLNVESMISPFRLINGKRRTMTFQYKKFQHRVHQHLLV